MSIIFKNVTKTFGDTIALNNVSVNINSGEFLAILGPSGCGKTTLLRTLAGFIRPDSGTLQVNENIFSSSDLYVPVENRNLGMVFQSLALWPHMNVWSNIEYPLNSKRNSNKNKTEKKQAVSDAIKAMNLEGMENRLPGELSGGQRQRVALARAIVEKPSILLMDEPLSALDAELKINMRKEIQDIHKLTKATIVYVTHDQSEALAMADRIMIMKDGKIEQIGTPQEIYNFPKTVFAATFVSKCNLIKGIWKDDKFFLEGKDTPFATGIVESCFVEKNVYPVRPEEFKIGNSDFGIKVKIINRQFIGREIHYKVQYKEQIFTVYSRINENFVDGQEVCLYFDSNYRDKLKLV